MWGTYSRSGFLDWPLADVPEAPSAVISISDTISAISRWGAGISWWKVSGGRFCANGGMELFGELFLGLPALYPLCQDFWLELWIEKFFDFEVSSP